MPAISIIIVNWRSLDYLRKCLVSLRQDRTAPSHEVIVIDNASGDDCLPMLSQLFPDVRFIQSEINLGFAGANNLAAMSATANVFLFLNPDTELVPGVLAELYGQLTSLAKAGIVGARLLNTDRSLQTSCIQAYPTILNQLLDSEVLERLFHKSSLWGKAALWQDGPEPRQVRMISGACMMLRKEVFAEVGGFSTDYFMYSEDLDLCYKVEAAGYKNYFVPDATVVHHWGGSSQQARSNFSSVMMRESIMRFLRKYRGSAYALGYRATTSLAAVTRLLLLFATGLFAAAFGRGLAWKRSFSKWLAILGWTVGGARWIRQYNRGSQLPEAARPFSISSCAASVEN